MISLPFADPAPAAEPTAAGGPRFPAGDRPSGYRRLKSAHSCRLCGRWLEGEWSSANAVQRARLEVMMSLGQCDRHTQRIEPCVNRLDPLLGGTPNGSTPPYRVLIPARDATPGQIPAGAAVLAAAAASHGHRVRVTYALAEERATGRMVHSCAVRVTGLGWATWQDGTYSSAWPNVNQAQFLALVSGAEYVPPEPRTPPPTGPCPRCGRPVRWKLTPRAEPYKHQRDLGGENSRGQRVPCE